jgi:DNA polymerase-3 subunit epsilon
VLDTLALSRQLHPGQRNSLDALCKRYGVDNSQRDLHGALLDARILADVYLAMTGGQAALRLDAGPGAGEARAAVGRRRRGSVTIPVVQANADELGAHEQALAAIERASGAPARFRALDRPAGDR